MGAEQKFIRKHGGKTFRYAEELVSQLREGAALASGKTPSKTTADQLLSIYEVRCEHLSEKTGDHAQQLLSEISSLCELLRANAGSQVELWSFSAAPNIEYAVFVVPAKSDSIVCTRSFDKRRTSAEEWAQIWA